MKQYELTEVLDGNYSNWSLCFEMWPCIQALNIKPYKDGNQWCFLYGENIQDGICGFGKTIRDAALDFYCNICNEEIVANKLKSLRPHWKPSEVCYGVKGDPDPAGTSDLEEAAEEYVQGTLCDLDDGPTVGLAKGGFIAGAEWGAKHLK